MKRFNIRVYGIIINQKDEVLLSDEHRFNRSFTKFPGGGLEWGEGTKEGLTREIKEELGLACTVGELIYVNDFFQVSAFREEDQIISFYFRIAQIDYNLIQDGEQESPINEDGEKFRWVSLHELTSESLTFPIDKKVAEMLSKS